MSEVKYRVITPESDEWPTGLLDPDMYPQLWVAGTASLREVTTRAVAVVGSRAATEYGNHVARLLAHDFADEGVSVISGLALGIDGQAHTGALAAKGVTVAVLPCGVDQIYPAGHSGLKDSIIRHGGLAVSAYPPGTLPRRERFLERNHLIAALSAAVVVVEAGVRSGAMSTANHADALERPVFAVPGPVTSGQSTGTHDLIKSGRAQLVTHARRM